MLYRRVVALIFYLPFAYYHTGLFECRLVFVMQIAPATYVPMKFLVSI